MRIFYSLFYQWRNPRNPSQGFGKGFDLPFLFLIIGFIVMIWKIYNGRIVFNGSGKIITGLHFNPSTKSDSCNSLLSDDGDFVNEVEEQTSCQKTKVNYTNTNHNCMKTWKPYGCQMHFYSKREALQCLKEYSSGNKYIFLIGDSRMRYIYNKMSMMLEGKILPKKFEDHAAFINEETNTNVMYIDRIHLEKDFLEDIKELKQICKNNPSIIVIGITLHMIVKYMKNPKKGLENFELYLKQALEDLNDIGSTSNVLWFVQPPRSYSLSAMFNKAEEIFELKTPAEFQNKQYDAVEIYRKAKLILSGVEHAKNIYSIVSDYNSVAENILSDSLVQIWRSAKFMGEKSLDDYMDHSHVSEYVNYNYFQIIFNVFCNKRMEFQGKFCCS